MDGGGTVRSSCLNGVLSTCRITPSILYPYSLFDTLIWDSITNVEHGVPLCKQAARWRKYNRGDWVDSNLLSSSNKLVRNEKIFHLQGVHSNRTTSHIKGTTTFFTKFSYSILYFSWGQHSCFLVQAVSWQEWGRAHCMRRLRREATRWPVLPMRRRLQTRCGEYSSRRD